MDDKLKLTPGCTIIVPWQPKWELVVLLKLTLRLKIITGKYELANFRFAKNEC